MVKRIVVAGLLCMGLSAEEPKVKPAKFPSPPPLSTEARNIRMINDKDQLSVVRLENERLQILLKEAELRAKVNERIMLMQADCNGTGAVLRFEGQQWFCETEPTKPAKPAAQISK